MTLAVTIVLHRSSDVSLHLCNKRIYCWQCPGSVCYEGSRPLRAGSGSVRHAATYSAGHPLAQFCVQVHSRSITKNILVVWRNQLRLRPTRTLGRLLCRCRSRATLAAVSRKVQVFELVRRGGCGAKRCQSANRKRAHDCSRPLLVLSSRGNDLGDRSSKRAEPRLVAQTDRLCRTIKAKFARR